MRYGFFYLQLAAVCLAPAGCLGGQTGDTTGNSDPFSLPNSPNASVGGSASFGGDGDADFSPGLGSDLPSGAPVGTAGSSSTGGAPSNDPSMGGAAGAGGAAGTGGSAGAAGEGGGAGMEGNLDGGVPEGITATLGSRCDTAGQLDAGDAEAPDAGASDESDCLDEP